MRKSLVFVLGAGASKEVNLPTGEELKRSIADALNFRVEGIYRINGGDQRISEAFHQLAQSSGAVSEGINPYLRAARLIRDAMPLARKIRQGE